MAGNKQALGSQQESKHLGLDLTPFQVTTERWVRNRQKIGRQRQTHTDRSSLSPRLGTCLSLFSVAKTKYLRLDTYSKQIICWAHSSGASEPRRARHWSVGKTFLPERVESIRENTLACVSFSSSKAINATGEPHHLSSIKFWWPPRAPLPNAMDVNLSVKWGTHLNHGRVLSSLDSHGSLPTHGIHHLGACSSALRKAESLSLYPGELGLVVELNSAIYIVFQSALITHDNSGGSVLSQGLRLAWKSFFFFFHFSR